VLKKSGKIFPSKKYVGYCLINVNETFSKIVLPIFKWVSNPHAKRFIGKNTIVINIINIVIIVYHIICLY